MTIKVLEERETQQQPAFVSAGVPDWEQQPVSIVVVGTGGGGSNAVNGMIRYGIKGVKFIAVNTDSKDLGKNNADIKLQIGVKLTQGRGAGGDPATGEKAALENEEQIRELLKGADMVFITAGMGGGTGTGSAPVIAKIAKDLGALTVAVVTKPFNYERANRMRVAEEGIARLREEVDTLIVIPNQKLLSNVERTTSCLDAFGKADDVLRQGVQGISDLIIETGFINIDFADAVTVMKDKGDALMSIGYGDGENRVTEAVSNAMDNPLLEDISIKGAKAMLIYVAGSKEFPLVEYNEIVESITTDAAPDANIIAGLYFDSDLEDRVKVTVIATGFELKLAEKESRITQMEIVRNEDDNVSSSEYQQMTGKARSPGCLPYRNSGYTEEDLDIPPIIRYRGFGGNGDAEPSGGAFAMGKAGAN
ncbi:MAG: cell division protein FtsZ [Treponema sp.]|jgi:cell division protein FtsZ|nr:cell division protein FtsZ [Treponema sp.]